MTTPFAAGSGGVRPEQQKNAQLSTFVVGDLLFGVNVERVQEVLRYQHMTMVPKAPGVVEGLINLRGQIVTAVDMRRRLEMQARPAGEFPMNMVVRANGEAVSLLVDEIGDGMEIDGSIWERPPENLSGAARDLISGVYKLKNRLLLLLDVDRTVDVEPAAGA